VEVVRRDAARPAGRSGRLRGCLGHGDHTLAVTGCEQLEGQRCDIAVDRVGTTVRRHGRQSAHAQITGHRR
jgi:hypothetical protein